MMNVKQGRINHSEQNWVRITFTFTVYEQRWRFILGVPRDEMRTDMAINEVTNWEMFSRMKDQLDNAHTDEVFRKGFRNLYKCSMDETIAFGWTKCLAKLKSSSLRRSNDESTYYVHQVMRGKQPIKRKTIKWPRVVGRLQNKQGNKRKCSQVNAKSVTSETIPILLTTQGSKAIYKQLETEVGWN